MDGREKIFSELYDILNKNRIAKSAFIDYVSNYGYDFYCNDEKTVDPSQKADHWKECINFMHDEVEGQNDDISNKLSKLLNLKQEYKDLMSNDTGAEKMISLINYQRYLSSIKNT